MMQEAKRITKVTQGLAGAFFVLALFFMGAVLFLLVRPLTFMPLGDYPVQTIDAPRGADGIPVVSLAGGVLRTTATKCNNWKESISVFGSNAWWRYQEGRSDVVAGTAGSNTRKPGCEEFHYTNRIPQDIDVGVWQIRGSETALGQDWFGQLTQTRAWETEPFLIVP